MSNRFTVENYPGKEIPSAADAEARLAVLTSAALSGRIIAMTIAIDGVSVYIFGNPQYIDQQVSRTIADVEVAAIKSVCEPPTIEISRPSELLLLEIHKSALDRIRFPYYP